MTAHSARAHTPADLRFFGCCDASDFVHYEAPSQSQPGKMNTVSLDTQTGATHCDCRAAEVGRFTCWHADLVAEAWDRHPAVARARALTDDALRDHGLKAAAMVAQYRRVIGRALPLDVVTLVACRYIWRERQAARAATAPAVAATIPFPQAALPGPVAA